MVNGQGFRSQSMFSGALEPRWTGNNRKRDRLRNGETMLLNFSYAASIFGGNEYDRKVDTLYLFMIKHVRNYR